MTSERLADRLAGRGVPDPRRPVIRCGDDALAVGAERRAIDRILMAFERFADRLAGRRRPTSAPSGPCRRGDNALAVGTERRAVDRSSWPLSGSPIGLPVVGVPQSRRLIIGRGDDAHAVGAERRAIDRTLMAFERFADRQAGRRVPQPRCLVPRRGDDALAVRAERGARDPIVMDKIESLAQIPPGALELSPLLRGHMADRSQPARQGVALSASRTAVPASPVSRC